MKNKPLRLRAGARFDSCSGGCLELDAAESIALRWRIFELLYDLRREDSVSKVKCGSYDPCSVCGVCAESGAWRAAGVGCWGTPHVARCDLYSSSLINL